MARKRLIKGANATRVEERIARVPEDIGTESNIFRALKALEGTQGRKPLPVPEKPPSPTPPTEALRGKTPGATTIRAASRAAEQRKTRTDGTGPGRAKPKSTPAQIPARKPKPVPKPSVAKAKAGSAQRGNSESAQREKIDAAQRDEPHRIEAPAAKAVLKLGPADFSAAERQAIVRCCADYRNRLPIYLQAVMREVEIIDSVIEKCKREGPRRPKR